jgi:hypothetical protein
VTAERSQSQESEVRMKPQAIAIFFFHSDF